MPRTITLFLRCALAFGSLGAFAPALSAKSAFHRDPIAIPDSQKVTVSSEDYPGIVNPNPRGWYYKCANVALAHNGDLVACWQVSDDHTSVTSHVMVARSSDGGYTWGDYQVLSSRNIWEHHQVWVVPQMNVLSDGRLLIVCDMGQRRPSQNWPMLAHWQKPDRGMSNHVFWSADHGRTWTGPHKVDDVGGEPGFPIQMSDGTIAFTRTSSAETDVLVNPPLPWGNIYYRNEIVFSDDNGRTWDRSAWVSDSPYHGDCEVALVELSPGKLLAATRIGFNNGRSGHPSRFIFSDDYGKTWGRAMPAPFYGQRVHIRKLQSGRMLATYRNVWGTHGSRAIVLEPGEFPGFQPTSFILDETRCELTEDELIIRSGEGKTGAVEFSLYPVQDDTTRIEFEATLKVSEADTHGCAVSAGVWLRFLPGRVCLADRPEAGFDIDTSTWHHYRIVREGGRVTVEVDGRRRLNESVGDLWVRPVRFGNRSSRGFNYSENRSVSHWRSISVKVENRDDHAIDWNWTPAEGYPDQFRRDRVVTLDISSDSGYSSWTQLPDGRIVIVDYTNADLRGFGSGGPPVFVRAYLVTESDLVRKKSL